MGNTLDVIVDLEYEERHYRRKTKLTKDVTKSALQRSIAKLYKDILPLQKSGVNANGYLSVNSAAEQDETDGAMYIRADCGDSSYVEITESSHLKSGTTLSVRFRKKEAHEEGFGPNSDGPRKLTTGTYKLWCPVHSEGQGYLRLGQPIGSGVFPITTLEKGPCHLQNTGEICTAATVSFEEAKPGDDDSPLRVVIETQESKKLYLGCNITEGTVVAATEILGGPQHYFDFRVNRLQSKTGYSMYHQILLSNEEQKTKRIGMDTSNQLTVKTQVDDWYIDPACCFTICALPL